MSSCEECNRVISVTDKITCSTCNGMYHYGCADLTKKIFSKLSKAAKSSWSCPGCISAAANEGTSAEEGDNHDDNDADGDPEKQEINPFVPTKKLGLGESKTAAHGNDSPRVVDKYEQLLKEIRAISDKLESFQSLKKDIKGLKQDLKKLQESSEETKQTVHGFADRLSKVEKRLSDLEAAKKTQKDFLAQVQSRMDALDSTFHEKEQWDRMNNVELKGVPEMPQENLINLVCTIGTHVQYPISKTHINFVTRVQSKDTNQTKPIIVCFNNRYVKEDFVAAARASIKNSPLMAATFGLKGNTKIYVNDHLTLRNKDLLTKTKRVAKEMNFQYIWVKHAKILVRQDDTSKIINIRSEKDLAKISCKNSK
ncbi:hypothetical protein NE865_15103 [Phthorimaea operculella]|nr:hypothetical protein NE865_15103 [Phthorimaea operculella]